MLKKFPDGAEFRSEDTEGVIAFGAEEKDGDFFLAGAGEVAVAIHDLRAGFRGEHVFEIWIRFDAVGDECCVEGADGEEGDGGCECVTVWEEDDEEGLEAGAEEKPC